jgi:SurA N-terminal domain
VARVGDRQITRTAVNHWMSVIAAEDYLEHVGKRAPTGLASDPPDYARCSTAAASIVPVRDGAPALSHATLLSRCRQLDRALSDQTMEVLISLAASAGEAAEQGIHVSDAEIRATLARKESESGSAAAFQSKLAERGMTTVDEVGLLRQDLISDKILAKFRSADRSSDWQRDFGRFLQRELEKQKRMTDCHTGYVVPQCKQFSQSRAITGPSPAIQLERLAEGH